MQGYITGSTTTAVVGMGNDRGMICANCHACQGTSV